MLDELLEFGQYAYDIDSAENKPQRLRHKNLKDGLDGIECAMTIVARQAMFAAGGAADIDAAKQALRDWCRTWFPAYVSKVLKNDPANDQKKCDLILRKIEEKTAEFGQYEHSMFACGISDYEASEKNNDYKSITYDKILALAFYAGPLKKQYLLRKVPLETLVRKHTVDKETGAINSKDIGKPDLDPLYKLIAAYLLEKKRAPGNEYVVINQAALSNWMVSGSALETSGAKTQVSWVNRYYLAGSKPEQMVFSKKIIGNNVAKLRVAPEIAACFALAEEPDSVEQFLDDAPEAVCLIDCGSGQHLREMKLRDVVTDGRIDPEKVKASPKKTGPARPNANGRRTAKQKARAEQKAKKEAAKAAQTAK